MCSHFYQDLLNVLPGKSKEFIGTVEVGGIDNVNKVSAVQLLSGEHIVVQGTSVPEGSKCLISDNRILNELPDLTSHNVTIY